MTKETTGPKRVLIYARVSTDAQERDGTSLDTQEQACNAYALEKGWLVVGRVKDTASGFSLDRRGLAEIRDMLRRSDADVVLAYDVDRLARNQNHIGVLLNEAQQAGVTLDFVTENFEDTAIGRFILAARAFTAEVEREKIAERTMRGKLERAKSGRLPQGTGPGCYGYSYDRETGKREVDAYQAAVVRRVFQSYLERRSFSAVSQELNDIGIPAFGGGPWYPIKVRRVLMNESYTGRLVYRRTKRVKVKRSGRAVESGTVVLRPSQDWIQVEGACPRIIDEALWERVQTILNDPERTKVLPAARQYPLRGRAKCEVCGSAMVGHTLRKGAYNYRYYRCRHIYDNNSVRHCSAKYVRGDELEAVLWKEVKKVLTDPMVVLEEMKVQYHEANIGEEIAGVQAEIEALTQREQRLVKLYSLGNVSDEAIRKETEEISRQKSFLVTKLNSLRPNQPILPKDLNPAALQAICQRIGDWLDRADEDNRRLVLEALQVNVVACPECTTIRGVIPLELRGLPQANGHADVRTVVSTHKGYPFSVPFTLLA